MERYPTYYPYIYMNNHFFLRMAKSTEKFSVELLYKIYSILVMKKLFKNSSPFVK